MEMINPPSLVEPGMKSFLSHTLKQCNKYKFSGTSIIYNIGMLLLFIFIIGGILYYKYKGRLNPYEIEKKNREKQEYIVSKLQQVSAYNNRRNQNLITNLPSWEKEFY
jgi:hypothetical protein